MASVHKRGDKWVVRYRDPSGRNRQRTFDRQRAAKDFAASVHEDLVDGTWIDPRGGRTLFVDWVNAWWATTVNLRPSSRASDESLLRTHVLPTFGDVPLGNITQLAVKAWVAQLAASGAAPATVAKAYQKLSKVLAAAVDAGLIAGTPCHHVGLPKIEREEMRFCTPEEIARLADAIAPRYRALVLTGGWAGLRLSELAGLRAHRVDMMKAAIRVAEQAVEVRGHMHVGAPKTKASIRTVPIDRRLADELAVHLAAFVGDGPDGLVFPGAHGSVLRANAWRRRFWIPACAAVGLGTLTVERDRRGRVLGTHYEGLRPHDLRHTYAAFLIASGASPLEVARRMGHTSTAVVLDRYGHLFPQQVTLTSERMAALWAESKPDAEIVALRAGGS